MGCVDCGVGVIGSGICVVCGVDVGYIVGCVGYVVVICVVGEHDGVIRVAVVVGSVVVASVGNRCGS